MISLSSERLFGLERDCVLRAPRVDRPLGTRQHAGVHPPRTLFGSSTPRATRAPELAFDVWAFRGQEGLIWDANPIWPARVSASVLFRLRSVATSQALLASDDGVDRSFGLTSLAGGALRWQVWNGVASTTQTTPTAYATGRWRWVTATYDPGRLRLFVDLSYAATATGPVAWNPPTAPITVGFLDQAGAEERLDADVAWFGVWTRVLSRAQIRELHRRPRLPWYVSARSLRAASFLPRRAFRPIAAGTGLLPG